MRILFLSPIFFFFLSLVCSGAHATIGEEAEDPSLYLADPTIFYADGIYYLYGTGGGAHANADQGFLVYTSTDLKEWTGPHGASDGYALKKGDSFGTKGFWAPQIFTYNNKYYMAYTADEFIAIASSDSPLGPFRQEQIEKLPATIRQIDPYVFFDTDGKIYLYHVRLTEGNRLFVAELNPDLRSIKAETLTECISAQEKWENTQNVEWPVAEGPTIIKEDDRYYFFYSTNDFRNIDYAVGYAIADSPYGPWKKYAGNPIIDRHLLGFNGTGHGDLFCDKDNQLHYVLHTHYSNEKVSPRRTALVTLEASGKKGETLVFKVVPGTFSFPSLK
ncbi:glycoside hydrolase family 43 protein [Parabacteroides sp. PF5-6]|uniref:glycoside hydrolase family 43 protein n=1 Tax=Parabacteroides sp. PF5-6 TaxID=1742403 RepID=UPI002405D4C6|nr:glycoside hydrolase family 43 protein [Parabacteroides sp. PF5-6]MDF9831705.1 xylan 1,4-beta-xylosidase [Parabacteroides sp. PF5-6]